MNGIQVVHNDAVEGMRDLDDDSIDLVVTSPPYNVGTDYAGVSDSMPWPDYYSYMRQVIEQCYRIMVSGGVLAINVPGVVRYNADSPHRHSWFDFRPELIHRRPTGSQVGRGRIEPLGFRLYMMMAEIGLLIREPVVWVKSSNEGYAHSPVYLRGSDNNPYMRTCHEMILIASKDQWHHRGGTGRRGGGVMPDLELYKDVWHIQPTSSKDHPATWPSEIPSRLIKVYVHADDAIILDPFAGSGVTSKVARQLGYESISIDQSALYCAMIRDISRQSVLAL